MSQKEAGEILDQDKRHITLRVNRSKQRKQGKSQQYNAKFFHAVISILKQKRPCGRLLFSLFGGLAPEQTEGYEFFRTVLRDIVVYVRAADWRTLPLPARLR